MTQHANNSEQSVTSPVLVLGATGMLGHRIMQRLSRSRKTVGTIRGDRLDEVSARALGDVEIITNVRASDMDSVIRAVDAVKPAAIVNCIGVIKQLKESKDPIPSIEINALFPHRVAALAQERGIRLVHFSTDCVFSGKRGNYSQDDAADATDLYGRSKLMGEVDGDNCVTIRSSIIGHELREHKSLIDWFISQKGGHIKGFANAHYSGLTTHAMAKLVEKVLDAWPELSGVWQVAADPINKYDLLQLINHIYSLGVTIDRDVDFHCDRRLDGKPFEDHSGWSADPWPEMIENMYAAYKAEQLVE